MFRGRQRLIDKPKRPEVNLELMTGLFSFMQPIAFPGSAVIKKPPSMTDEECSSAWAIIHRDEHGEITGFTTCWKPNYEDLQALNKGEGIYVHFPGSRLAPMSLFTLDDTGKANAL